VTQQRLAYLVSHHPKLSHAFIDREIDAVRQLGLQVETFSVRRPDPSELRTDAAREAAGTTTVLLGDRADVLRAVVGCFARHPLGFLRTLGQALRTGPSTLRARLWQLFYLAEAVVLHGHLVQRDLHHVHVHLANNAADVARLATSLARRTHPSQAWTWSLAMHGPTEFADVAGFDLAAKVRSASFVACITDFCRSQLMALVGPDVWPRLHVVRMSVDLERYQPRAREHHDGPLRVLFVGRLVAEKGPDLLVDAVGALDPGAVSVRIVGAGPLREHLEAKVAELGRDVTLVGPLGQDELPDEYAAADVLVLPSAAEGLPVVLMEAMACGVPVVTTRITGIPELVEDGVSGILVTPGRADLVADALVRVRKDPDWAERLGMAGHAAVSRLHRPDEQATVLVKHLREVA
jgi:colanic acid/amylovoran biosynthesis glycosyltransferase